MLKRIDHNFFTKVLSHQSRQPYRSSPRTPIRGPVPLFRGMDSGVHRNDAAEDTDTPCSQKIDILLSASSYVGELPTAMTRIFSESG